jgi:hypothetical protein
MNLGKLRRRYTYGRQSLKWFPDDDIIILKATTEKTNNPQESLTIIETILEKKSSDQKH